MTPRKPPKTGKNGQGMPKRDLYAELDDVDKAIIQCKALNMAMTSKEIGERIRKSRQTVEIRLQKIKVKESIELLHQTALDIILNRQADIALTAYRHTKSRDEKVSLSAALGLLDKVVPDKKDLGISMTGYVKVDIKEIKQKILDRVLKK